MFKVKITKIADGPKWTKDNIVGLHIRRQWGRASEYKIHGVSDTHVKLGRPRAYSNFTHISLKIALKKLNTGEWKIVSK